MAHQTTVTPVTHGTILELTLKDRKQIKWKLSDSMPLNEIVEGLKKGLGLSWEMNVLEANASIKIPERSQTPGTVKLEMSHCATDREKQKNQMEEQELLAIILSGITIATMIIVPLIAVSTLLVIPSFIMSLIAWKNHAFRKKTIIALIITDGMILLFYMVMFVLVFME